MLNRNLGYRILQFLNLLMFWQMFLLTLNNWWIRIHLMLQGSQLKLSIEAIIELYHVLILIFLFHCFALLLLDPFIWWKNVCSLIFCSNFGILVASAKSLAEQLLLLGPLHKLLLLWWPFEISMQVSHSDQVLKLLWGFVLASQEVREHWHGSWLRGLRNKGLFLWSWNIFARSRKAAARWRILVECLTHNYLL